MKRMILITSPPACGKTHISKLLASKLDHVVYLDKDTLIPLSKQVFRAAKKPYDRSSDFFEEQIRDYEYEVIVNLGLEALTYDDTVLINAPFTREVRDKVYLRKLNAKLKERGAKLAVVWIMVTPEVCRERMTRRASERDAYKLRHWDEYIATVDFSFPAALSDPECCDEVFLFFNSSPAECEKSMSDLIDALKDKKDK